MCALSRLGVPSDDWTSKRRWLRVCRSAGELVGDTRGESGIMTTIRKQRKKRVKGGSRFTGQGMGSRRKQAGRVPSDGGERRGGFFF